MESYNMQTFVTGSFTLHILKIRPCRSMYQYFIPWYGYPTFYLSTPQLMDIWVVSNFWLLSCRYAHSCTSFVWTYVFLFLRYMLRYGISGSYGNSVSDCKTASKVAAASFSLPTSSAYDFSTASNIFLKGGVCCQSPVPPYYSMLHWGGE